MRIVLKFGENNFSTNLETFVIKIEFKKFENSKKMGILNFSVDKVEFIQTRFFHHRTIRKKSNRIIFDGNKKFIVLKNTEKFQ